MGNLTKQDRAILNVWDYKVLCLIIYPLLTKVVGSANR